MHPHLYFYPRLVTTIISDDEKIPFRFKLDQNYPNPFNPSTTIRYQLSVVGRVELTIFNISGQYITTLVKQEQVVGNYQVQWDGRDNQGIEVSSGVYFYRLKAEALINTRKMLLVR